MGENMSPADVAAVVGNTDRNNFAYPVFTNGGFGNSGFGNSDGWLWIILLLALFGGFGNNGNGGFGGFNNDYAWLSNGQKEIMQNTNQGFNTLHLSNQVEGVRDGINELSSQICNGFYNAEIGANNRQMADMQQSFNNQLSTLQGFNQVNSNLDQCCCENRLATERLNATILSENCADRYEAAKNTRDIIEAINLSSQSIKDQLCQDKIDSKNEKIADLQRQLQMADLKASQIAQTDAIREGIYNELKNCPVGTVPVFGNQPIFTCSNNVGGGCGCSGVYGNTIV